MITVVRLEIHLNPESSVQMEDSENIAVTSETKVISDQVSAAVNYHVILSLFQFLYFSHYSHINPHVLSQEQGPKAFLTSQKHNDALG